jgi:hypothetical protein
MIRAFAATATTCEVSPGSEHSGQDGIVHVHNRTFTDIVRSKDQQIAGVNKPVLDLEFNPADGTGSVHGRFTLQPDKAGGAWEGHMTGEIRNGLVNAKGLARGNGALDGSVMRVDFRQVEKLPGEAPCPNPTAFFEMEGSILDRD